MNNCCNLKFTSVWQQFNFSMPILSRFRLCEENRYCRLFQEIWQNPLQNLNPLARWQGCADFVTPPLENVSHKVKNVWNNFSSFINHLGRSRSDHSTLRSTTISIEDMPELFEEAGACHSSEAIRKDLIKKENNKIQLMVASDEEEWWQILAHHAAYRFTWSKGEVIPLPKNADSLTPVCVRQLLIDDQGFQALVLTPQKKLGHSSSFSTAFDYGLLSNEKPAAYILFRGTAKSSLSELGYNVLNDTGRIIGLRSFLRNQEQIQRTLEDLSQKYAIHVLGHSLGGALAQLTTAAFPQHVQTCSYYNSPGIDSPFSYLLSFFSNPFNPNWSPLNAYVDQFNHQIQDPNRSPYIKAYRHPLDLPSLTGGRHLPANVWHSTKPAFSIGAFVQDLLAAHSLSVVNVEDQRMDYGHPSRRRPLHTSFSLIHLTAEIIRSIGLIIPLGYECALQVSRISRCGHQALSNLKSYYYKRSEKDSVDC